MRGSPARIFDCALPVEVAAPGPRRYAEVADLFQQQPQHLQMWNWYRHQDSFRAEDGKRKSRIHAASVSCACVH